MAITPTHSTVTVTTAGTAVQATADTNILPSSVYFEADKDNTGDIYIGVSDVDNTHYITKLTAGQGYTFTSDGAGPGAGRIGGTGIQLSNLYVDSSVNGEQAQMTYMYPVGP